MKKYIYSIITLALLGCNKYELENPNIDVTADKLEVAINEEINFTLNGNPPILYFYSGEFLNDYYQKSDLEQKNILLSFSSQIYNGTQPDQLEVLISNDFNGDYSINNIRNTPWKNITHRFIYSNSQDNVNSGNFDIIDSLDLNKPLYLAFKFTAKDQTIHGASNLVYVNNIQITSEIGDQIIRPFTYSTSNFSLVSFGNKQAGRTTLGGSAINFKGNGTSGQTENTEDWVVSRPISLSKDMIAVNKSIPLKIFTEARKENFTYAYKQPGNYKATFVGETNNVYGNKKVVKTLDIVVKPL